MPGSVELCVLIFSNSMVAGTGDLSGSRVTLSAYLLTLLCPLRVPQPACRKQLFLPFLCSTVRGAHFVDILERTLKVTAPGWLPRSLAPPPSPPLVSSSPLIFHPVFWVCESMLHLWDPVLSTLYPYPISSPNMTVCYPLQWNSW